MSMDFEEELQADTIRKTNNANNHGYNGGVRTARHGAKKYQVFDHVYLMFNDLINLKQDAWVNDKEISIFDDRVHFKNCLCYCTVVAKYEKVDRYVYLMDDSTAAMEVRTCSILKKLNRIQEIENNLTEIQHTEPFFAECLREILLESRRQLNSLNFAPGTRVLLCGKPSYFLGKVSIDAFYMYEDNSADRQLEIAFKEELINWYKNKVLSI